MTNGWTGGQYSAYRIIFGLYLFVLFSCISCHYGSNPDLPVSAVGIILALGFILGFLDKVCALGAICLLGYMAYQTDSILDLGTLLTQSLLLFHIGSPPAPIGSLAHKFLGDPNLDWQLSNRSQNVIRAISLLLFLNIGLSQILLSLRPWYAYIMAVYPLLFLIKKFRSITWLLLLFVLLSLGATKEVDFVVPLIFFHLLCFSPNWLKAKKQGDNIILYDGHCGFCHKWVIFVLAEDRTTPFFRFKPNDTESKSIVLQRSKNELLIRSEAVVEILKGLGGLWYILGVLIWLIPYPARDLGYRFIASIRHKLSSTPEDVCPVVPENLRQRFL
ncbi:MAG: DUF393 domain-containing protein [Deltaproteobacteria bacterium]|nr:DUF393 domain-containing protein [Deltaproteobacteria bacterium]